jgi:hypothetical protein
MPKPPPHNLTYRPVFSGPVEKLVATLPYCDSSIVDRKVFEDIGFFICRGLVDKAECLSTLARLNTLGYLETNRNEYNPVQIQADRSVFESLWRSAKLGDELERLLGPNISLYGFRFVIKDERNRSAVFLHNDVCYHKGGFERLSAFVALTSVSALNGGMEFYPGTHHFGYLGDAGELDPNALQPGWPTLLPSLEVGDVVFMHSALWHCSGENVSGTLRVLADIHYQPATDPSGICIVRGISSTEYGFDHQKIQHAFKRSRVSRMIELEREVRELKGLDIQD